MKCTIYCRYSDSKQDGGYSIEAQRDACVEYAAKNNYEILQIFEDKALSGTNDQRKAFQEMVSLATSDKKAPFDILLVHNTNRFARNRFDSIKYKHLLKLHGVKVLSVSQGFVGTGAPEDVIFEGIFESLDEYYSKNLARETMKGMRKHVEKGYWKGGNPPFGYELDRGMFDGKQRSKLKVYEPEAIIVRRIYQMYNSGIGYLSIATTFNKEGLRARSGGVFTSTFIAGIIKTEVHTGVTNFGTGDYRIRVENSHPQIISPATRQKVIEKRDKKFKGYQFVRDSEFLLSGVATCQYCGSHVFGSASKNSQYFYYECRHSKTSQSCQFKRVPARNIEQLIVTAIRSKILTKDAIRSVVNETFDYVQELQRSNIEMMRQITHEIEECKRRLKKLYDVLETSDSFDAEDLAPRMAELKLLISEKQSKLMTLDSRAISKVGKIDAKAAILRYVDIFTDFVMDDSFLKSKARIQSVVQAVVMSNDNVRIVWKFPNIGDSDLVVSTPSRSDGSPDTIVQVLFAPILSAKLFYFDIQNYRVSNQ